MQNWHESSLNFVRGRILNSKGKIYTSLVVTFIKKKVFKDLYNTKARLKKKTEFVSWYIKFVVFLKKSKIFMMNYSK